MTKNGHYLKMRPSSDLLFAGNEHPRGLWRAVGGQRWTTLTSILVVVWGPSVGLSMMVPKFVGPWITTRDSWLMFGPSSGTVLFYSCIDALLFSVHMLMEENKFDLIWTISRGVVKSLLPAPSLDLGSLSGLFGRRKWTLVRGAQRGAKSYVWG